MFHRFKALLITVLFITTASCVSQPVQELAPSDSATPTPTRIQVLPEDNFNKDPYGFKTLAGETCASEYGLSFDYLEDEKCVGIMEIYENGGLANTVSRKTNGSLSSPIGCSCGESFIQTYVSYKGPKCGLADYEPLLIDEFNVTNNCTEPSPSPSPSPSSKPGDSNKNGHSETNGFFKLEGSTAFETNGVSSRTMITEDNVVLSISGEALNVEGDFSTQSVPDGAIANHGPNARTIAATPRSVYNVVSTIHVPKKSAPGTAFVQVINSKTRKPVRTDSFDYPSGIRIEHLTKMPLGNGTDVYASVGPHEVYLSLGAPYTTSQKSVDSLAFEITGPRSVVFKAESYDKKKNMTLKQGVTFDIRSIGVSRGKFVPVDIRSCTTNLPLGFCVISNLPLTSRIHILAKDPSSARLLSGDFTPKTLQTIVVTAEYNKTGNSRLIADYE